MIGKTGSFVPASIALLAVALLGGVAVQGQAKVNKKNFAMPNQVPAPADNKVTAERVKLGQMLFFDPRLSGSHWISCATCHNPAMGWSDGLPTAIGNGMAVLKRSTPPIVNSAFNKLQMWDGRFSSLEEQAAGPLQAPGEMNGSMDDILDKLKSLPGYVEAFDKAYPSQGITRATLAKAVASFERTIISKDSPFDAWAHGNQKAVSASAKRGYDLFVGKANCVACHSGYTFTDNGFHNIGLNNNGDEGRFAKVPVKLMRGAFKTPALRDVARHAPYMHNGQYATLEQVIDHYDRGGDDKSNLDPEVRPLGLTGQEKKDLVQFLKTLSGKPVAVTVPRLPR